ncbi:hypothetical protein Ocin01_00647 [Orchesella cincta]|uniref:Uncharacterized protein n=1 Tax=Orchesella cincta TaxID=48709 RepID=A0A1D2NLA4_ORCCI|nr:hypothetical protein Ocin01_00647 [Orchesella cincta]
MKLKRRSSYLIGFNGSDSLVIESFKDIIKLGRAQCLHLLQLFTCSESIGKMDFYRNFETYVARCTREARVWLRIFIVLLVISALPLTNGVINGKMKDKGLYVIQSVAEPRYVLTVAGDAIEKTRVEGELLSQVVTSKWINGEEQKWTVKSFGKHYYFLTPVEKKLNNVTYKIYMEDFPIPNIWELHGVEENKHWMIKMHRGKCLRLAGLESPLRQEKCDKKNEFQLWNFHLLNQ